MSIKKNIQAFREWAYSNNAFKKEPTTLTTFIDPTWNSKTRNRIKWENKKNNLA